MNVYYKHQQPLHKQHSNPYKCVLCKKEYKLKSNYTKHTLFCETINKTQHERIRENDTDKMPTMREMYSILLEVTAKYSQLEKKMEEMTKWTEIKKRKLNVIEWLNETNLSTISFNEWSSSNILITRKHLDIMFKHDYIHGCIEIIKDLLSSTDLNKLPLKSFNQKENTLFIATLVTSNCEEEGNDNDNDNDNDKNKESSSDIKWEIMSDKMFIEFISKISKQLLTEFIKWQKENTDKIYEDEFSNKYAVNFQKILGGNNTQEYNNSRIKKELYKYLKTNLKNIIEYEFSF